MLLGYAVDNFRSFKEEAFLDLRPAKSKVQLRYKDNFVTLGTGEKVLKEVVIVGENAGGKSNFVESLAFVRDLLARTDLSPKSYANTINSSNAYFADDSQTRVDPSRSKTRQSFYFEVALDQLTYVYQLVLDRWGIVEEGLSYRSSRKGAESEVFRLKRLQRRRCPDCDERDSRETDGVSGCTRYELNYSPEGDLSSEEMERFNSLQQSEGRRLTLVWMATVGDPYCRKLLNWLVNDVVIAFAPNPISLEKSYASEDLLTVLGTEEYLDIVKLVDPSITGLILNGEHPLQESSVIRVNSEGKEFRRRIKDDSAGVQLYLCWAFYVYLVLYRNKTVIADEIDSAINPTLSDRVIALVNGSDHHGQFIFTTHNIFNLTLRTHMKEQIYFISKDRYTLESSLYSAADFDEIRYDVKGELYELYLKGLLGGTANA